MDPDFNPPGFLTEDEFDDGDLDDFGNFSRSNRGLIRSNKMISNIGMNRMPPELIITPAKVCFTIPKSKQRSNQFFFPVNQIG